MSEASQELFQTAEEMRRAFDASFAVAPAPPAEETRDLLAVRVGGGHYGLDLKDLIGLEARRTVVPLPARDTTLLGIAGVRGRLVPVYDLGGLLGEARAMPAQPSKDEATEGAHWLAICNQADPVGLAFDELEAQLRLSRTDFFAPTEAGSGFLAEAFVWAGITRRVLKVGDIIRAIEERAGTVDAPRE